MKKIDFGYFIERYISGEMKTEENAWFEKELEGDYSLRKEVDLRRKADEILQRDADIRALRSKMRTIAADHARKKPASARIGIVRYAAAIAILAIAGTALWFNQGKLSNEEIFEQFYSSVPVAGESVSRSLSDNTDDPYLNALDVYRQGDYNKAISLLLQFTAVDQDNPEVFMMLGNSYAETDRFGEAGASYRKVIDHNDNLYIEDAHWMLALCYIRTGETGKAVTQLSTIAASESRHSRNAAKALRKLNKKK